MISSSKFQAVHTDGKPIPIVGRQPSMPKNGVLDPIALLMAVIR